MRGDPSLVEMLRSEADTRSAGELVGRSARCWDRFGLPDGSRNPGRERPDGLSLCSTPGEDRIHRATNALLSGVLAEWDLWLLDIPRVLLPGRSSAEIVVSRRGVAMGLPWSAFGGLFFTNFLSTFLEASAGSPQAAVNLTAWRARRARWRLRRRVPPGLCRYAFREWLYGDTHTGRVGEAVGRLEDALTMAMRMADQAGGREIWAMTTFQQAIMIMHEFGHVVEMGADDPSDGVHEHSLAEELRADLWDLEGNRRLARHLFGAPSLQSDRLMCRALLVLFATLEFTEYPDPRDPRRQDMAVRCGEYIRALAGTSELAELPHAAVENFFATMRRQYAARLPGMELFILSDHFLQQMSGRFTYADENARATVEPRMTPWGLL